MTVKRRGREYFAPRIPQNEPVHLTLLLLMLSVLLAGCSRSPSPPRTPKVSAKKAAARAMVLYDANRDGQIDSREMEDSRSPLQAASWLMDADKNGTLSKDEIAARIRKWQGSTSVITAISPTFYFEDKPLGGATVTLEPAEFLGASYRSVSATTDAKGVAHFTGKERQYPGIYLGLYRVRVSKREKDNELIPTKYNADSELVHEVALDSWGASTFAFFDLRKE